MLTVPTQRNHCPLPTPETSKWSCRPRRGSRWRRACCRPKCRRGRRGRRQQPGQPVQHGGGRRPARRRPRPSWRQRCSRRRRCCPESRGSRGRPSARQSGSCPALSFSCMFLCCSPPWKVPQSLTDRLLLVTIPPPPRPTSATSMAAAASAAMRPQAAAAVRVAASTAIVAAGQWAHRPRRP